MATLGGQSLVSLVDQLRRDSEDMVKINAVNVLTQTNQMWLDIPYVEANNTTSHVYGITDALPNSTWKTLNNGLPFSADKVRQATEQLGVLGQLSYIDEDEVKLFNDWNAARMSRDKNFLEKLGQDMQWAMLYGNQQLNPAAINGLSTRFSKSSGNANVILNDVTYNSGASSGGTKNLASMWLCQWDMERAYAIYPKGHPFAGISVEDKGLQQMLNPANGTMYWAWVTRYLVSMGLAIPDPRCTIRIANIETASGATKTFHEDAVIDAMSLLNGISSQGSPVLYVNRHVMAQITKKAKNFTQGYFTKDQAFGGQYVLPQIFGIPIRVVDKLGNQNNADGYMNSNETLVS